MKLKAIASWWQSWHKYPQSCWIFSLIWLLVINWVAFIWHLGSTSLVDETEPLFAEAARQMTVTGDWITPYYNGETRFDKPPLIYWLMAAGYKLIGVNEWAVRFPSAMAAIALVCFGFYTLRYFGFATPKDAYNQLPLNIPYSIADRETEKQPDTGRHKTDRVKRQLWLSAWIGAALIAFNLQTIVWARTGVSDMLLSGCMGTALFCFFWGYVSAEKRGKSLFARPHPWYLAFYILIALAVLTKGPVGIVLPGLIIFTFLLYTGKLWSVLQEMGIVWGGLIFLALTVPWYVLVILENGQAYIDSFFGHHNFQRFTDVVNGHDAPWYFYFLIVLLLFAPWSVYLPYAIARIRFWQVSFWREQPRYAQLSLFTFFWFSCIFIFFTVSVTKLPSYVLPLLPAAAILVAQVWNQELTSLPKSKINYALLTSIIFNFLFVIALAIAFVYCPNFIGKDPAIPHLKESIIDSGLPWRGGIVWGISAMGMILFLKPRKQWRWLIAVNLVSFFAFIIFVLLPLSFFVDQNRQLPLKQIAETIIQVQQPQEKLWMIGFEKPTLVFYTHQPVTFLKHPKAVSNYLQIHENNLKRSTQILLVSRAKDIKRLKLQPQDYQKIDAQGAYHLIRLPVANLIDKVRR